MKYSIEYFLNNGYVCWDEHHERCYKSLSDLNEFTSYLRFVRIDFFEKYENFVRSLEDGDDSYGFQISPAFLITIVDGMVHSIELSDGWCQMAIAELERRNLSSQSITENLSSPDITKTGDIPLTADTLKNPLQRAEKIEKESEMFRVRYENLTRSVSSLIEETITQLNRLQQEVENLGGLNGEV